MKKFLIWFIVFSLVLFIFPAVAYTDSTQSSVCTVKLQKDGAKVASDLILNTQKWVSFDWVYQPDGTTNLSSGDLSRGSAFLYSFVEGPDGPDGSPSCGFIFSTSTVTDFIADVYFYSSKEYPHTFWANNGSGGIHDMGAASLESVTQAPDAFKGVGPLKFYDDQDTDVIIGHTYCIVTKDGAHYAKFYVTDMGTGQPPVADAGEDQLVYSGDVVTFDGSDSSDSIVSYSWKFGDGSAVEGRVVDHRFRGAMIDPKTHEPIIKTYTVELTVKDDKGDIDTDTVDINVKPLEKSVPVEGLGYEAGVTAVYNWVKVDESGEDVYIVSKITSYASLFRGGCEVDINDGTTGISKWRDMYISHDLIQRRTWVSPFTPNKWIGIPCPITKLSFPEDALEPIEVFEGIEVHGKDEIAISIGGVTFGVGTLITSKPELTFDEARTMFYPDTPELQLGPGATILINSLISILYSPGELRVYDSQGNVTGLVNRESKEEIPNSNYDDKTNTVVILYPSDTFRYEVIATDEGAYGLDIFSIEDGKATIFTAVDIPTLANAIHQYTIDWNVLSRGEKGATVQIDADGDGAFEKTFTTDRELTHDEFISETAGLSFWIWIAGGVGIILILVISFILIKRRLARR